MLPFEHIITIDKESATPVYRQIAVSVIHAVRNGVLKPGTPLPGSRELAGMLGVHRKTVVAAYEELMAQDWIVSIPRKYVAVSDSIPAMKPRKWNEPDALPPYARAFRIPFRTIDKAAEKDDTPATIPGLVIDDGHPDVRLSPIDDLLKTYRALTARKYIAKNAAAGSARGALQLREELVTYLSDTRGLNISPGNLLITHGAQMSIYLSAHLLLGPGTNVITGRPNYPVANRTFEGTGARIMEVPVDGQGIDTAAVEAVCKKKKISAVYVIPHHHYPTTVTLSVERRMQLLELSRRYSFAIIEDDYDYDYHYSSSPYLPLASAQHSGNVIYIGSFSKILDPSIRMGFMAAPENFIAQCTALRKTIDVGGDAYMQSALAALIKTGELKRHLKKARKCYHQRRDYLDALLQQKLGKYLAYTLPSGGMAIWVQLRPEYPVQRLSAGGQIKILGVDVGQNAFRFGFASMDEQELEGAVTVLEKALRKL